MSLTSRRCKLLAIKPFRSIINHNKKRTVALLTMLAMTITGQATEGNDDPCRSFAVSGSEKHYKSCSEQLQRARSKSSKEAIAWFDEPTVQKSFMKSVESGKSQYIAIGFDLLSLLDGAAAEDLSISLGMSITAAPKTFLESLHEHFADVEKLNAFGTIVGLGPEYEDKIKEGINILRKRISAIQSVADSKLENTKKTVIAKLKRNLKQFESYQEAVGETALLENNFNIAASSALSEKGYTYTPQNLLDSDETTAWCEGNSGEGIGEWIQIYFNFNSESAISIVDNIDFKILPGYAKSQALYAANARPAKIRVGVIDHSTKKGINNIAEQVFKIQDKPEWQTFRIPIESKIDLSKVELLIKIEDVYQGAKYKDMCVTELTIDIIRKGH